MTVWFTADMHIGDANIIRNCRRPFATVAEMDRALVENWNAVVKPDDEVWNLGDFAVGCTMNYAEDVLRRLNGRHNFVKGNHDETVESLWMRQRNGGLQLFDSWTDGYRTIDVEGVSITLCHYSMREWPDAMHGSWHLFGHTHGALRSYGKSVDVGVDSTAAILISGGESTRLNVNVRRALYRPVSFGEVKAFMARQNIGPHPVVSGSPR